MTDTCNTPQERSEAEILAELDRTRAEMTATVDELVARVQPEHMIEEVKERAKTKASEVKNLVVTTVQEAREGDPEALKKVGYVIAGGVALGTLVVLRALRRRR